MDPPLHWDLSIEKALGAGKGPDPGRAGEQVARDQTGKAGVFETRIKPRPEGLNSFMGLKAVGAVAGAGPAKQAKPHHLV
jgi:DNA polymerase III sliding clamp (beta) subunit (PCNA family)